MKKFTVFFCSLTAVLFTLACVACVSLLSVSVFATGAGLKIVIDAGHGGIDGGVAGRTTGVKESDINLAIAMLLKDGLEDAGFAVTLTRKTDGGLYGAATSGFKKRDMQKRKQIIEEAAPSLVISVHQNYYSSSAPRGGQVFYRQESEAGKRLAESLQKRLNGLYEKEGAKARTTAAGDYFILKATEAPSVIAECGFLSNEKDEAFLSSAAGKQKLASCLAAGVLDYLAGEAESV